MPQCHLQFVNLFVSGIVYNAIVINQKACFKYKFLNSTKPLSDHPDFINNNLTSNMSINDVKGLTKVNKTNVNVLTHGQLFLYNTI